ncbi:lipopolysaccharide biosynthesis protein [Rhodomicrobium vannielii ATCC 17100]|uniref:Lipopolysaccharide biosynthesis protein n=2 Tax=Rhodomicrobium vannielii TaxID=1069 RepID=E3I5G6_RHOVT|nr:lipopolysaccharide biosynthesis protein [Rhodomicrobium vannielii ATCC 17100]
MSDSASDHFIAPQLRPVGEPIAAADPQSPDGRSLSSLWLAATRNMLAIAVVAVPVSLSIIYYAFIAADIYVSEAHFAVRSKAGQGGLGVLSENTALQALTSMSASLDETRMVNDYLSSRDAIKKLAEETNFRSLLSRPEADFLTRFPRLPWSRDSQEALYERYSDYVSLELDTSTGISTLRVFGFRPSDPLELARILLDFGEQRVNQLNERAQQDTVTFAKALVSQNRERLKSSQVALSEFREREKLFDPKLQGASTIDLIAKLNFEIARLGAELDEVSVNSPGSPKITSIKTRIDAMERETQKLRNTLVGSEGSLSSRLPEYERLAMDHGLSTKTLMASLAFFDEAVKDTQQQRLYLQRVVEPNSPDYPLYPKKLRSLLLISGFFLCIYFVLQALGSVILEHDK